MKENTKKVYLKSWGCQMNVRDSEVIAGLLTTNDYQLTTKQDEADVIIFNTCSVRQHAEDKVWSEIGRLAKLSPPDLARKTRQIKTGGTPRPTKKIVGLVGCMAQNYKEEIFKRAPAVDFVVGPSDIHRIPEVLDKLLTIACPPKPWRRRDHPSDPSPLSRYSPRDEGRPLTRALFETKIWETDGDARPEEIYHTGFYEDKDHAYVVISEGCSTHCSYCVVPYVRGELHNRDYNTILKETREAVDRGITRITLLGQNVNAYQFGVMSYELGVKENINFVKLLKLVNQIKGLKEFSFMTSHPKDTSVDLFKAMAECDKLKKNLHLPIQSGSNKILKLMNRGYAKEQYLDLADDYHRIIPEGVLTTDIIVGFPTETEKDFLETYELMKKVKFHAAYIFKYSPRPHTEAEALADDVPREEKQRRHKVLLDFQRELHYKK